VESVEFNANDWTGRIYTVKYRTLKDGTVKFNFRGDNYKIIFTSNEDDMEPDWSSINGKCYSVGDSSPYPIARVSKFGKDKYWTATDDDYINGITRDHQNPVAAVCQILSNIM